MSNTRRMQCVNSQQMLAPEWGDTSVSGTYLSTTYSDKNNSNNNHKALIVAAKLGQDQLSNLGESRK